MAFGVKKQELNAWKQQAKQEKIAFLTHYWIDPRFPGCTTVTKVACQDVEKLVAWGRQYGLKREWIHKRDDFPHFDLLGETQRTILLKEGLRDHLTRFSLLDG
ncbi:hypothetical protein [Halalkalibacterium ligniniphilum]|uniref:hypothetical protein n=1 Tax=Halalkalibacterium ligniniphilum TaxID=1134413 RepID=UPI000349672E|nr:hypothetical protein [Halalkalibacterium ligniniphilum]